MSVTLSSVYTINYCDTYTCNGATGVTWTQNATGSVCPATACESAGTCNSGGQCVQYPLPASTPCPAIDSCHQPGSCNGIGACTQGAALPDGSICKDSNWNICNGTETCKAGTCQAGSVQAPTSPEPCTTYTCDSTLGWQASTPAGAPAYCSQAGLTFPAPTGGAAAQPANMATLAANLYTGSSAVQFSQTGYTLSIDPVRAGILRGRVLQFVSGATANSALSGVTVTIQNHPEMGYTLTGSDGRFNMAVNTGSPLVVDLQASGYLRVQRTMQALWQDISVLDDIVMIQPDPASTVTFGSSQMQWQFVAGQKKKDGDGTRTAYLLIPPSTVANGGSITSANVSVTEYTYSPSGAPASNGAQAMPGTLPANSAYTYAAEARATDPTSGNEITPLTFNQNIYYYVDNFIDAGNAFPLGASVPAGYYDRSTGAWVAGHDTSGAPQSGMVLEITGFSNGQAQMAQPDGGLPPDLSSGEQTELYNAYCASSCPRTPFLVWRVPMNHFTPWDMNWGWGPPAGAQYPNVAPPLAGPIDAPCIQRGSIIECENQILHETIPIVGTPFSLNYSSDRVPGSLTPINVQIAGATVPNPAPDTVLVLVWVAGQRMAVAYPPPTTPNQWVQLYWDRHNAYGQLVEGQVMAHVSVGYEWQPNYASPASGGLFGGYADGTTYSGGERQPIILWKHFDLAVGDYDASALQLGGWTISPYHDYQPSTATLYLGDGTRRSARGIPPSIASINTTVYKGVVGAPDGSLYASDTTNAYHIDRNFDAPTVFAGGGSKAWEDNIPPTQAILNSPSLAMGPDGSLYLAEPNNANNTGCAIRKIDPSGQKIQTVVGYTNQGTTAPTCGWGGDGSPATSSGVQLNFALGSGFRVLADGSILIADTNNNRVRRVRTDGVIETIAGNGQQDNTSNPTDAPAVNMPLSDPTDVDVGPDGTIYVVESLNVCRVRSITPDGIMHIFAGTFGCASGSSSPNDGIPATSTQLAGINRIAVDSRGTVYILEANANRVRSVDTTGFIHLVAGAGGFTSSGNGGPAAAASLSGGLTNNAFAVLPDGSVVVDDSSGLRRVAAPFPGFTANTIDIPSASGAEVYEFDQYGNHLDTKDGLRGVLKYAFTLDSNNYLGTITDYSGSSTVKTTIDRSTAGQITISVAPFGQQTVLALDSNGYLSKVTNPNSESIQLSHEPNGLLDTLTDAKGQQHKFTYDALGRLTSDQNPAGGSTTLANAFNGIGWSVTTTSATGYTNQYTTLDIQSSSTLPNGGIERRYTSPASAVTDSEIDPNGTTTTVLPDGSKKVVTLGPDPRFGMLAPVVTSSSFTTGSTNRSFSQTTQVSATGTWPGVTYVQTATKINGSDLFTSTFQSGTNQIVIQSPTQRQVTLTLDGSDRVIQKDVAGIDSLTFGYDAYGRLHTVTQSDGSGGATRSQTVDYDSSGFVKDVVDALSGTTSFEPRDSAGRVKTLTMRDGVTTVTFTYDANGNLSTLTPPGQPTHNFPTYSAVDLLQTYDPPDAGQNPRDTSYSYTPEGFLGQVSRPEGTTLTLSYDSAGRLFNINQPSGDTTLYYAPQGNQSKTPTLPSLPLSAQSPDGTVFLLSWDGPLLTSTQWTAGIPAAHTVNRGYDGYFRVNHFDVDGGNAIDLTYDTDGLLKQAKASYSAGDGGPSSATLTVTRDPNGTNNGLIWKTAVGSVSDDWTSPSPYNGFGEPMGYTASTGTTQLYQVSYQRDSFGRITSKSESIAGMSGLGASSGTTCYVYDTLGRLTKVLTSTLVDTTCGTPSATRTYLYDAYTPANVSGTGNGNRTQINGADVCSTTPCYDAQDRLLTYGSTQFAYTNNGDLHTATTAGQTTTYAYDLLGNLTSVALPSESITYHIDGANRRVAKLVGGAYKQGFVYADGIRPVAELDGSGNVLRTFVYGTRPNTPDLMVMASGNVYRVITDQVGSPRLVVNVSTGNVAERLDYDEFGNVANHALDTTEYSTPIPFAFAGGLYDWDTGLLRFGARDYDPAIGRWTVKDPASFAGGTNVYLYCGGDPVNFIDVYGNNPALAAALPWLFDGGATAVGAFAVLSNPYVPLGLAIAGDAYLIYDQGSKLASEWDTDAFLGIGQFSRNGPYDLSAVQDNEYSRKAKARAGATGDPVAELEKIREELRVAGKLTPDAARKLDQAEKFLGSRNRRKRCE